VTYPVTYYEDENDNYNYEKGVYSTIAFHWNDAAHRLIIDARKGEFPGMLQTRSFQIVLVRKNHGTGVEVTEHPDKVETAASGRAAGGCCLSPGPEPRSLNPGKSRFDAVRSRDAGINEQNCSTIREFNRQLCEIEPFWTDSLL
jgi:hypothetical protein